VSSSSPPRHLLVRLAGWELAQVGKDLLVETVRRSAKELYHYMQKGTPPGVMVFCDQCDYEVTVTIREVPLYQGGGAGKPRSAAVQAALRLHPLGHLDLYPLDGTSHLNCAEALRPPKCECGAGKVGGRHSKWCPLYVPLESS
jgi:hypothetical protein